MARYTHDSIIPLDERKLDNRKFSIRFVVFWVGLTVAGVVGGFYWALGCIVIGGAMVARSVYWIPKSLRPRLLRVSTNGVEYLVQIRRTAREPADDVVTVVVYDRAADMIGECREFYGFEVPGDEWTKVYERRNEHREIERRVRELVRVARHS